MGMILDDHGPISVEARSESFYVHASYGYRDRRYLATDLQPGDHFRLLDEDQVREVHAIDKTHVHFNEGRSSMDRDSTEVVKCDEHGVALDVEEDPDSGSFGRHWRETPHPEFRKEDLNNLQAALVELGAYWHGR